MKLYIPTKYNKSFAYNYITRLLYRLIKQQCSSKKFTNMNRYFKEILGLTYKCADVIDDLFNNLFISKDGDYYIIDTFNSNQFRDTKYRINDLTNLIDFGNLEVKGTHIFAEMFAKVNSYLDLLYNNYRRGGR